MNGLRLGLLSILVLGGSTLPALGQAVNGYTYIAPSVYPAPPIVVYDPALLIPAPDIIYPRPWTVTQPVVPYGPVWAYPPVVPGPIYRERMRRTRFGPDYTYRAYVPGRAAPVYTYKVDAEPYGVRVRERFR